MIQNLVWALALIVCSLSSVTLFAQPHHPQSEGHIAENHHCDSCNGHQSGPYSEPYPETGYFDEGPGYFDQGCDCGDCTSGYRTPIRSTRDRLHARAQGRFAGRFGGQDISYGRPGDWLQAPFIDGRCGDCNWGPFYLSIFAGVAFIDNLDSRFTFDNGTMGQLGVQETGFTTLDGVAAGGAIGRYFYRQARMEFEYTFRDNGVGEMTEFTFDDILATPQINDTLVSSVVTPADGNIESNSFMWNILVDLQPRTVGCMNAYAGGGIGVLYVDSDIATPMAMFDINDTSFAFQGIAGVNFPFRERVDLFTEYRFLGADSIGVTRADMAGLTSLGSFRFDSHSVVFGLRFLR